MVLIKYKYIYLVTTYTMFKVKLDNIKACNLFFTEKNITWLTQHFTDTLSKFYINY